MHLQLTQTQMLRAFKVRDSAYDGLFFVAVKTTGIFCRPVCKAKPPRPENVEFFPTAQDALYGGYRPCKRCRPLDAGTKPPPVVARLMEAIDADPARRMKAGDLRALGVAPSTARRQFQGYCGMTFHAYQRARRMGLALKSIRKGDDVMQAQVDTGYESGSGFREAFSHVFGAMPSNASDVRMLTSTWIETPLGPMLAIANDEGLLLLDFIDRKGLENALLRLRKRLGNGHAQAVIVPGEHRMLTLLKTQLKDYFAGRRTGFSIPINPQGTPFERACWESLLTIPSGATRSYAEQAKGIGKPAAVRAVGRANGMNNIAIVIPCHRVVGADGALTGYGGGLARKQWLLDHERRLAAGLAQV
jgi:AraC family transcriptional regulator of adaptative response/methylated-DNA-[protein]-cysteine methyltransferase